MNDINSNNPPVGSQPENPQSEFAKELESYKAKIKKLWQMNEAVYKEKKKADELNDTLIDELNRLEGEKSKYKEKTNKLWAQSVAIHKEKERIDTLKQQLEHRNKEILDSINYAKRIQNAILPPVQWVKNHLSDSFILYLPKDIVAGDFYWAESVDNNFYLAAADCTGHGVPGAMVSVICSNALHKSLIEERITDVGKILDRTREIVIQQFMKSGENVNDGMDISLCALQGNTLQWAGANNPLWIIRKNPEGMNELVEVKPNKQPIGKYTDPQPFTTHSIELNPGDAIYIFTDGYQDQFGGEKGKKFKASQLKELLLSIQHQNMEQQKEILNQAFEQWKGTLEQIDDVCIIGVCL